LESQQELCKRWILAKALIYSHAEVKWYCLTGALSCNTSVTKLIVNTDVKSDSLALAFEELSAHRLCKKMKIVVHHIRRFFDEVRHTLHLVLLIIRRCAIWSFRLAGYELTPMLTASIIRYRGSIFWRYAVPPRSLDSKLCYEARLIRSQGQFLRTSTSTVGLHPVLRELQHWYHCHQFVHFVMVRLNRKKIQLLKVDTTSKHDPAIWIYRHCSQGRPGSCRDCFGALPPIHQSGFSIFQETV
jgi:hypothetical protein